MYTIINIFLNISYSGNLNVSNNKYYFELAVIIKVVKFRKLGMKFLACMINTQKSRRQRLISTRMLYVL